MISYTRARLPSALRQQMDRDSARGSFPKWGSEGTRLAPGRGTGAGSGGRDRRVRPGLRGDHLALWRSNTGIRIHALRSDELGGHRCRRMSAHRLTFDPCFTDTQQGPILAFVLGGAGERVTVTEPWKQRGHAVAEEPGECHGRPSCWVAYDPSGVYAGTVDLADDLLIQFFSEGLLIALTRGEMDEQQVKFFDIERR